MKDIASNIAENTEFQKDKLDKIDDNVLINKLNTENVKDNLNMLLKDKRKEKKKNRTKIKE